MEWLKLLGPRGIARVPAALTLENISPIFLSVVRSTGQGGPHVKADVQNPRDHMHIDACFSGGETEARANKATCLWSHGELRDQDKCLVIGY